MALECIRDLFGLQSAPLSSQLVRVFPAAGSLSITTLPRWSPLHECVYTELRRKRPSLALRPLKASGLVRSLLTTFCSNSFSSPTDFFLYYCTTTTLQQRRPRYDAMFYFFSSSCLFATLKIKAMHTASAGKKAIHQVDLPSIKLGSNLPCSHIGRPSTWLILCCRRM